MENILEFIQKEQWEEAKTAIAQKEEQGQFNDTLAILSATVSEHFCEWDRFMDSVEAGLKYNYKNYELYLMLGNYYADRNIDQAYLCYENAEYYCKQCGNVDDLTLISEVKQSFFEEHDIAVKPYSFVILSYNTLELTQLCIESIRQNCSEGSYEIIIIDNASSDGSIEWLRAQKDIVLVENAENVGFPAGCNQGIRKAKKENDIMLLNSDTIVMPNSMFSLRMGLYAAKKNGAAGSVTNYADNEQTVEAEYKSVAEYQQYAEKNNIPRVNALEYKVWLIGFAMLLKRTVLNEVGLLDERFTPGNFEDNDLGIRFLQHGYRNVLCWNSFILHWGSRSFQNLEKRSYEGIYDINKKKYEEKWGIDPEYYTIVRWDLIGLLEADAKKSIRVLEVGCGAGVTLGKIKYLYPNAEVHGIEIVEEVASIGAANFDIICHNIETMDIPYEKKYFDYIILGDVLEHLVRPDLLLERLKNYLKDDGYVIASIPNMMHAQVIYDLLQGRFPYEDAGIRDKTHLRFFTYREIVKLFEGSGYQADGIFSKKLDDYTTSQYQSFFDKLLAIEGVAPRDQFDTYQYLIKAGKASIN